VSFSQTSNDLSLDEVKKTKLDWALVTTVIIIITIGLVNIYSASSNNFEDAFSALIKQGIWVGFGLGIVFLQMFLDYRFFQRLSFIFYFLNLGALLLVPFMGVVRGGAKRWLDLGFMNFQPSETMKFATVLALAQFFHNREGVETMGYRRLFLPLLIVLVPFFLIVGQPDLGTSLHLLITGVFMILFIGVRKRVILFSIVLMLASVPFAWKYALKDYQKDRVLTFFNPMRDPKGKSFNTIQAMIAVGSGQVSGKGFKKGTQTQLDFTPEKQTDFIFTVVAEEWGFLGACFLILAYLFLFFRCLMIAHEATEKFGALVCLGFVALLGSQVFINIGMVMGIVPVVGLPLPFLSYGGTSMLTCLVSIGMILNISYRKNIF